MPPRRPDNVLASLKTYANSRSLDLIEFTDIHTRLTDSGFTTVDVWPSTGSYYVLQTDYNEQGGNIVERGGEKGKLPIGQSNIWKYLDKLFYAVDINNDLDTI